MYRTKTKILLDGGDASETQRIKQLLGVLDGQTTNPSLIAKNPEVKKLVASEHGLSVGEQMAEYRKIVRVISPLVGDAGVSIEVFAEESTTAEEMLDQALKMFAWIPNAFIKYPCTREGLRAAKQSIDSNIRVNMTLCFSQAQAAAVYAATKGTKVPVYVSPFVGRLDDIGENGVDLVANIKRMYANGDGHVAILAASIRSVEQLLYCFSLEVDLVTVPAKVLDDWAHNGFPIPEGNFKYTATGQPIPYQELVLDHSWPSFDVEHELTRKGIEKFTADYRATLSQTEREVANDTSVPGQDTWCQYFAGRGQAASFTGSGLSADVAAKVIAKAVTARKPHTRYTIGRDAALLTLLARVLPDRILDRVIAPGSAFLLPKEQK